MHQSIKPVQFLKHHRYARTWSIYNRFKL